MHTQTYIVTGSYADRDGVVWVFLRGLPGKYAIEGPVQDGDACTVVNGKAVRA
ncbi:hypothetical protein [Brevundimonas sp.]